MIQKIHPGCLLLLLVGLLHGFALAAQTAPAVVQTDPPVFGFYAKLLNCDGIPIRSADVAEDRALTVACDKLERMLAHLTIARVNLRQRGAELHVIGKDQPTSALPELHSQQGETYRDNLGQVTDIDKRTRGVGGLFSSCGEENLLGLPNDRYRDGYDICTHEFAHAIMNDGLGPGLRSQIEQQYKRSTGKGLWQGHYASVNPQEYFAELSMWYFGAHGEFVSLGFPAPGPESLRAYDPGGYALLDAIYSGHKQPEAIRMVAAKHVSDRAHSGQGDQQPSHLLIANDTAQKLKLFWIDASGKAILYGQLTPYSRSVHETWVAHVWSIQDSSGKELGRYQANAVDCVATIGR